MLGCCCCCSTGFVKGREEMCMRKSRFAVLLIKNILKVNPINVSSDREVRLRD